jgi:phage tail sheath protein FI
MPEYLSPGVYVEEVDRGPKPIEGVATTTASFIGFTEKAELVREIDGEIVTQNLTGKPHMVTSWSQYVAAFGDFVTGAYLPHAVYGFFNNGGTRCYIISVKSIGKAQTQLLGADGKPHLLVKAKTGGFDGLRYRVSVEVPKLPAPAKGDKGDDKKGAAEEPPPFTIVVERQAQSGAWIEKERVEDIMLEEVQEEGGKTVQVLFKNNKPPQWIDLEVPDGKATLAKIWPKEEQQQALALEPAKLQPANMSEFQGDVAERTGVEGLEALDDVTMVIVPDLMTVPPGAELDLNMVKAVQMGMIAHCERMGDRVAILDPPPNMMPMEIKKWRMETAGFDSSYAALYYPWIQVQDPILNRPINIPPAGHMAGVWARNDNTRGVHKAPANEVVLGAVGLAFGVTKGEQDTLNPIGVNCIRAFPGRGIRVWGARTLTSNPSWRYINVRRLFNFVEKSIEGGTQWVVFEPNDQMLWGRVRRDVTAFLTTVWSSGALFGSSPDQAFYVKCDEELNPPESRDLGRLIIEIGMSPVKPAEFVIFRISQWAGG